MTARLWMSVRRPDSFHIAVLPFLASCSPLHGPNGPHCVFCFPANGKRGKVKRERPSHCSAFSGGCVCYFLSLCVSLPVWVCLSLHVFLLCVFISLSVCCVSLSQFMCVSQCVFLCVSLFVFTSLSVCVCFLSGSVYLSVYVCLSQCVLVYLCNLCL